MIKYSKIFQILHLEQNFYFFNSVQKTGTYLQLIFFANSFTCCFLFLESSVARHFGIEQLYDYYPEADIPDHDPIRLDLSGKTHGERAAVFQYNYLL